MRKSKSKLATFTALVLLVTIIAIIMVSGTYAKYTTELSGSDTVTVASFSVGGNISDSFNLFDTIAEVDAETSETHVSSDRIAPGTGGKFAIELTNDSEVDVSYELNIEETTNTAGAPIEYSTDGTTYYTAADLASATNATGTLLKENGSGTVSVTLYWRWAYEGTSSTNYQSSQTDATDTAIGESAASSTQTLEVEASAVFEQID